MSHLRWSDGRCDTTWPADIQQAVKPSRLLQQQCMPLFYAKGVDNGAANMQGGWRHDTLSKEMVSGRHTGVSQDRSSEEMVPGRHTGLSQDILSEGTI